MNFTYSSKFQVVQNQSTHKQKVLEDERREKVSYSAFEGGHFALKHFGRHHQKFVHLLFQVRVHDCCFVTRSTTKMVPYLKPWRSEMISPWFFIKIRILEEDRLPKIEKTKVLRHFDVKSGRK